MAVNLNSNNRSLQLEAIAREYENCKGELTSAQRLRAEKTIKDMQVIEQNFQKIASFENDDQRNKEINKLTNAGAEDGFSSNLETLSGRIDLFIQTHLKAKQHNDLKGFFGCFTNGGACLSGRIESMSKYSASLDGIEIDSMPDPEKSLFFPGTIFAEIISDEFNGNATLRDLRSYISENLDEIAEKFKSFENGQAAPAFLAFLENRGFYQAGTKPDWKLLIGNLAESKYFPAVFEQSLKYVV